MLSDQVSSGPALSRPSGSPRHSIPSLVLLCAATYCLSVLTAFSLAALIAGCSGPAPLPSVLPAFQTTSSSSVPVWGHYPGPDGKPVKIEAQWINKRPNLDGPPMSAEEMERRWLDGDRHIIKVVPANPEK